MIEDARRLCSRSPILFRMSTRRHIIASKNTRYGIDHGTMFRTLTTSRGIKEIISLSAAYFNSLDSSGSRDKQQEMIRPRFLQMLVLLLALLNDEDLNELGEFLETTYRIKADRKHIELLILKVLPLMSINSKVFINSLVDAIDGPDAPRDPNQGVIWNNLVQRLLQLHYMLPGTVDQLGHSDLSWVVRWPEDGIKDSHVFNHLQYAGQIKTMNDIPPFDLHSDSTAEELTVSLTNQYRYVIGTQELEKITCMTAGKYSVTEADGSFRIFDLDITEQLINGSLCDAITQLNEVIGKLNHYLASPRRRDVLTRMRSIRTISDRYHGTKPFPEVKSSGRLTHHFAVLNQETLAVAYKVEGRKITRQDLIRNLSSDLRKVRQTVHRIEATMQDFDVRGIDGETRQKINALRQLLAGVQAKVALAEENKTRLERARSDQRDEPVQHVMYPSTADQASNAAWNDYDAVYVYAERVLQMSSQKATVKTLVWEKDETVRVDFMDHPMVYYCSPLKKVPHWERADELRERDWVLLAGQYLIVLEQENGFEYCTNWLKITGVQPLVISKRGANRQKGNPKWRTPIR